MAVLPVKSTIIAATLLTILMAAGAAQAAETATDADKTFVAKVSQGGMFEVELGKIAALKAPSQMIRDDGMTESHDHALVNIKLRMIATAAGIPIAPHLNPEFKAKLDQLSALTGPDFERGYITEMQHVHNVDGGLFADEARNGGNAGFKTFAAETHRIVEMHIGALDAAAK